jgi:hypothetical protein
VARLNVTASGTRRPGEGSTLTSAAVETVSRPELQARRKRLLQRAGTTWPELRRRAQAYALTDHERDIYDTIRGIDWLLSGKGLSHP